MKYVIASIERDRVEVDVIVSDPTDYVSQFEPIDVVNGKMLAWDENGGLYHFGPERRAEKPQKLITVVDVGHWNFEKGEPYLMKIVDNQEDLMREALVDFLNKERVHPLKKLFGARPTKVENRYLNLTLQELLELAAKQF
ncbi:MAG: hypothetical protein ACQR33_04460 [Candidatus Saccharibacteria bacterium]